MSQKKDTSDSKPYSGSLDAQQAAAAIQAARLNARDLLDSAEVLFNLTRFAHSVAFSTLAIEESAKVPLALGIFLGYGRARSKLWTSYRRHTTKTSWLNPAIESRVRAAFPEVPHEAAQEIGRAGPTPAQLEVSKQRAIYADCLDVSGDFAPTTSSAASVEMNSA